MLSYRDRKLYIDGVEAISLANQFGTPLYVVSEEEIKKAYNAYREAFKRYGEETGKEVIIAYAYKANSSLAIARLLAKLKAGADVVSGGELYIARIAGVDENKIVFNGNAKTKEELEMAVELGIRSINVDNLRELRLIDEIAKKAGKVANVALRVNPNINPHTHAKITTGLKENKFGLSVESVERAVRLSLELNHVRIIGLHAHVGSQIRELDVFEKEVKRLMELAIRLEEKGIKIEDINIGGGLGIDYSSRHPPNIARFSEVVINTMLKYKDRGEMPNLILEPGRSLVARSSVLLMRVLYIKETNAKKWAMVDAGMNDFMRVALYNAKHRIINAIERGSKGRFAIAGGICESSDVFGEVEIGVEEGDVLAMLDVGAYGISMANNYNAKPKPAMVLISRGKPHLIRERETYSDLISKDVLPPHLL